jgi:hypothetical protein
MHAVVYIITPDDTKITFASIRDQNFEQQLGSLLTARSDQSTTSSRECAYASLEYAYIWW